MRRGWTYLISTMLLVFAGALFASGPIHLKTRNLTANGYPAAEALRGAGQSPGHLLVQLSGAPRPEDLRELQRRGVRVVGSAPDGELRFRPITPSRWTGCRWSG